MVSIEKMIFECVKNAQKLVEIGYLIYCLDFKEVNNKCNLTLSNLNNPNKNLNVNFLLVGSGDALS